MLAVSGRIERMDTHARLRALPKTDDVLAQPELAESLSAMPRAFVLDAVRASIDDARARILGGEQLEFSAQDAARDAAGRALLASRPSLRRVINATGIIVHTNLGRSVLSDAAAAAVADVATHYSTLEYDVESGERGSRHVHCEGLLCRLTRHHRAYRALSEGPLEQLPRRGLHLRGRGA